MKRLFNTYELLDIISRSSVETISDPIRKRVLFAVVCAQMCFEQFYLYLTSARIDGELFTTLCDPKLCANVLEGIYAETGTGDKEKLMKKVLDFLPHFLRAIQPDQADDFSEKELQIVRAILKCSAVTSVASHADSESGDPAEWAYRNTNKELAKQTKALLTDIGAFALWMPRKAREGVKISDVSCYHVWTSPAGFKCQIEFYLSRIDSLTTGVHIKLIEASYQTDAGESFIKMLGKNPLRLQTNLDMDKFGYCYLNVLRLNNNDPSAAEQIASIIKRAYEIVCSALSGSDAGEAHS